MRIAELTDLNRNLMMSIDIVPVPTDEAVREAESRLLGVETNITNWQRKQNQNNNFSATVPYDMEQQKKEMKEFLDDLIYGHHMNDGSMFAGLMKFKDKSFWEKHKTVSFDTLTDRQTYEVIAVFKTVVYTDSPDSFKYYQFVNADTAEDFTAYVEKCKKLSLYETGITAEYGDKLLTLSTCEYSRTNGRLVVVAKLINE